MRTLTRNRHPFAPDELVVAAEPFSASLAGAAFTLVPSDPALPGNHRIVKALPHMFVRERAQEEERAAYFADQEAKRAAERQRQRDAAAKAAEADREAIERLAAEMEPRVRKQREQAQQQTRAFFTEDADRRRSRLEAEEQATSRAAEAEAARTTTRPAATRRMIGKSPPPGMAMTEAGTVGRSRRVAALRAVTGRADPRRRVRATSQRP